MRQYRGLTKDGTMIYGWLVKVQDKCYIVSEPHFSGFTGGKILHHEIWGFREVTPKTVGQQIGLKNGKEIYEGDIIQDWQDHNFEKWVVMWWPEQAQFVLCNGSLDVEKAAKEEFELKKNDRIIGNIHQHPELMEQGNGK